MRLHPRGFVAPVQVTSPKTALVTQEDQTQPEGPQEQGKGVEMRDDFDGALEDVPAPDEDAMSEEGSDTERLDQAVGDTGEQVGSCTLQPG